MIAAMLIAAALVNFVAFFAKMNADFSRADLFGWHSQCSRRHGHGSHRHVGVDHQALGAKAGEPIGYPCRWPRFTLPFAYHIDAETHGLTPDMDDPTKLDRLAKYLCNMDEIIISCEDGARLMWAEMLKGSGRHGEIISEFTRTIGALGVVHHDDANVSGAACLRRASRTCALAR